MAVSGCNYFFCLLAQAHTHTQTHTHTHTHTHTSVRSSGAALRTGSAQSWLLQDRLFLTLFFTDLSVVLYAVQLSDPFCDRLKCEIFFKRHLFFQDFLFQRKFQIGLFIYTLGVPAASVCSVRKKNSFDTTPSLPPALLLLSV